MKKIKTYEDFVNEELNLKKALVGAALGASIIGGMSSCKKDDIRPSLPVEQKIEQNDSLSINIKPGIKRITGGDASIENNGYELFKNRWDWKVIVNGQVVEQGYISPGHPGSKNYTSAFKPRYGQHYLKIPISIGDKVEIEMISDKESKVNTNFYNYGYSNSGPVPDTNDLAMTISIMTMKNIRDTSYNTQGGGNPYVDDAIMTNQIEQNYSSNDMGVIKSGTLSALGNSTGAINDNIFSQKTTIQRPSNLPSGNVGLNKVNMKFVIDEDLLIPN